MLFLYATLFFVCNIILCWIVWWQNFSVLIIYAILSGWFTLVSYPDSKVHGAKMGPTWVLSAPDGPHVGLMNLAIRVGQMHPSDTLPPGATRSFPRTILTIREAGYKSTLLIHKAVSTVRLVFQLSVDKMVLNNKYWSGNFIQTGWPDFVSQEGLK